MKDEQRDRLLLLLTKVTIGIWARSGFIPWKGPLAVLRRYAGTYNYTEVPAWITKHMTEIYELLKEINPPDFPKEPIDELTEEAEKLGMYGGKNG